MRLGWRALTDLRFLVWSGWFWYNSLLTTRAQYNHQSCRLLAWLRSTLLTHSEKIVQEIKIVFSLKCREEEEREFGERVEMNKTAVETIKLFHDKREMADFLSSSQVVHVKGPPGLRSNILIQRLSHQ